MRVMLANMPWNKGRRFGVRAGSRWPFTMEVPAGKRVPEYMPFPFYLAYATALLERHSFDVAMVDAIAEGSTDEAFLRRVDEFRPEVFVAETSTPSFVNDLKWIAAVKRGHPQARIILCGLHATVYPKEILEQVADVDCILLGEYEVTLLETLRAFGAGGDLGAVRGLAFRRNGVPVVNERRSANEDLDELPWPHRASLPMRNYNDSFASLPKPNVQMWTSRGCPYQCIFCNWPTTMYGGNKYRVRSCKSVVDEMEWLVKEYGFKAVYIDDDTTNIGKQRMLDLAREIKARNLKTPWAVMARADTSDLETFKAMRDAGLFAIKFGVESSNQKIVDAAKKALKVDAVVRSVGAVKALGIKTHLTFSFGLPGETEESMQDTLEFALDLAPDSAQFSIITPFPGTEYFKSLKAKGRILSEDWDKYDGNASAVFAPEGMSLESLEKFQSYAVQRWNERLLKGNIKELYAPLTESWQEAVL